ncbi:helix-turn-helix domain-containing protein [Streptomyces pakalii]|uniref:Helix-turn-helix transcriptional regulator n=1 Tax=Streptomyces pakalii TaxID=3036494 RepID=A0ABT7DKJ7_9ACTN|nr:helix-turn-helix transcriptional regulator [Streptomyces pakalii]MDJ1645379.1 helix-turn-helix transcriptional regulator [Streptomyces pakalii]
MPARSHPAPNRPPRSQPAVDAARAARCTEAIRDIAEDFVVRAEELLHQTHNPDSPATDLVVTVAELGRLTEEATAALVVRQRSQGEPLKELTPALGLTEDRLRKKYHPQTVDLRLASRSRARRELPDSRLPEGTSGPPSPKNRLRVPGQRLACALTLMQARSGVSQRALAERLEVDPSYVSRILSGERDASWRHVTTIVDSCDGNVDLVKPLWEAAVGVRPTGTEPARYLRNYLIALRYAAGSPTTETILASTHNTISAVDLRQALEGPGVPVWPVVSQITNALQGLPDITRPLWRRAIATTERSLPAEAFG